MSAVCKLWSVLLLPASLQAATARFELDGMVEDVDAPVHVSLYGTDSPFETSAMSNSQGHFRFRNLQPGTYTVSAFVRRHGEARRTVVVTGSFADAKGIVRITIPLPPETSSLERARRRSMVSLGELSIPGSARQLLADAQKDLARRDTEHAIARLKKAVEIAPRFSEAWNSLGVIAYETSDYPQAEQYFRKAVEAKPGSWTPMTNLGGVLLNLDRPQEALKYNRSAVELQPNDALANSQLGMNYFQLGQYDDAERYLAVAERIDPSHFSHPQLILAQIYAKRGDRDSTLRELNDYIRRFPDDETAKKLRDAITRYSENH